MTDGIRSTTNRYKENGMDEEQEQIIQECICLKCFYRWLDVRPVGTKLSDLECPSCHKVWYVIGTGEQIEDG